MKFDCGRAVLGADFASLVRYDHDRRLEPLMAFLLRTLTQQLTPRDQRKRADEIVLADAGYGYDVFGMHRGWIALGMGLMRGMYDSWFRVVSQGHEHIPTTGAAIIAANHSGTLPFDAAMLWADIARKTEPPRVARSVADHFVPNLPVLGTLFARTGAVGGSRANLERLLSGGALISVFPEGTPGIGKHFRDRYKLQPWRVGHAELALRFRAPVIPTAIVGAEEQMPQIARIPVGSRLFGAPYLPITLTPFPLPVRYHIRYGKPVLLHEHVDVRRAAEPSILRAAAHIIAERVDAMLQTMLSERQGVFR